MAAHSTIGQSVIDTHCIPEMHLDGNTFKRIRHASEQSDAYGETSETGGGGRSMVMGGSFGGISYQPIKRKGPVRSMTEVRPNVGNESFIVTDAVRAMRENHELSPMRRGTDTHSNKCINIMDGKKDLLNVEVTFFLNLCHGRNRTFIM